MKKGKLASKNRTREIHNINAKIQINLIEMLRKDYSYVSCVICLSCIIQKKLMRQIIAAGKRNRVSQGKVKNDLETYNNKK